MQPSWIRMDPYPIRIRCPLSEWAIWIQRHTGGMSCDDRSRDWTDAAAGQGMPRIASNHQQLERDKERRKGSSPDTSEGA